MTVTFLGAWHHWFKGDLQPTDVLWGLKILWWARWGKLAQGVAGLTILAEIIGSTKLRAFGNSLQKNITEEKFLYVVRYGFYLVRHPILYLKSVGLFVYANPPFSLLLSKSQMQLLKHKLAYDNPFNKKVQNIYSIVSLLVFSRFFSQLIKLKNNGNELEKLSKALNVDRGKVIFIELLISYILTPVATLFVILVLVLAGWLLDKVLIEPIAKTLDHQNQDKRLKITALVLLVVGFYFDFLAS